MIYARGPMAYLFHTTHEQTHIAHVMAYSACIGPYVDFDGRCKEAQLKSSAIRIRIKTWPFIFYAVALLWSLVQSYKIIS